MDEEYLFCITENTWLTPDDARDLFESYGHYFDRETIEAVILKHGCYAGMQLYQMCKREYLKKEEGKAVDLESRIEAKGRVIEDVSCLSGVAKNIIYDLICYYESYLSVEEILSTLILYKKDAVCVIEHKAANMKIGRG